MAYDRELVQRVRAALATLPAVREVRMFGGLSFMVDEAMVMNVGSAGDLLVRVDPHRDDEYLQVTGAHPAEMGAGRTMGRGWLSVDADAVAADDDLAFWVDAALDLNRRRAGEKPRSVGPFAGFPPELFTFYEGLAADNSKAYWEANKATWTNQVREPMKALLAELENDFPALRMFRPNRDLRFAKDKSPYKPWVGATSESKAVGGIGYYVHVEASALVAGFGAMVLARDQLQRFRAAIDADGSGQDFEQQIGSLAAASLPVTCGAEPPRGTMPPGFAKDHPRAQYLRWKGAVIVREYPKAGWMHTREALEVIRGVWRGADPLREWLGAHVMASSPV